MMTRLIFAVAVFAAVMVSCSAEKDGEEISIRSQREKSNNAIAAKDTAGIAAIWSSDYHIISSRNAETSGRRANAERFATEFAAKPDVVYVRTPGEIKVFAKWKMASEFGTWVGHWTEDGKQVELKGTYYAKWHKLQCEWKIRAEIFVPLSCTGGTICEEGVKLE